MTTRRWLKIGSGAAAGIISILGLFQLVISLYGFQITDVTGNILCIGTYDSPCISEFLVKNPNPYVVDIYSKDNIKLDFSPQIRDYAIFVSDGRCTATGKCACDMKNGKKIGFKGWRCTDFTNKTKLAINKEYNFRFPAYSTTKFKLVGIKTDPRKTIKWTFGAGRGELDPYWYSSESTDLNLTSWWTFDIDTNVTDRQNNYNFTGVGVGTGAWQNTTDGVYNASYYFNGSGYLTAPIDVRNWSQITVSSWFKSTGSNSNIVNFKSTFGLEARHGTAVCLWALSNNTGSTINVDYVAPNSAGCITSGQWIHLVGTYNTTHACLYANSVLKQCLAITGLINYATWSDVTLWAGRYRGGASTYGVGQIDSIQIWNRSLTSTEIKQLYQCKPRNAINWQINNTNCFINSEDYNLVGYNMTLFNNSNITLTSSNLTAERFIINKGSKLSIDSTSKITLQ